jgi:malate/lactate dehydrogenase
VKVTIVGGGGRVGSCAAFALQCSGLVAELQLLDANQDLAQGEALDLLHGSALAGNQRIFAGDYRRAADSDMFLITAGLRRKPDESRLDLINRNVARCSSRFSTASRPPACARTRTSSSSRIPSTSSPSSRSSAWSCRGRRSTA